MPRELFQKTLIPVILLLLPYGFHTHARFADRNEVTLEIRIPGSGTQALESLKARAPNSKKTQAPPKEVMLTLGKILLVRPCRHACKPTCQWWS